MDGPAPRPGPGAPPSIERPLRSPPDEGRSFAAQGIGIEEALFELGLVSGPFYDSIAPADPAETAALEAWFGAPLPRAYREFLDAAGGSLGTLRIVDWRTPWDFRPRAVLDTVQARPKEDQTALRRSGQLPIAVLGQTMEVGYDHDVCLLLDQATGEVVPEDSNRRAYESLTALLLEWGHRNLDPAMAVPIERARAWASEQLPPAQVAQVHQLAAYRLAPGQEGVVGRWLGVYRYHRSGLILRREGRQELWVEAYGARRVAPERTAAAAVLAQGREQGLFR